MRTIRAVGQYKRDYRRAKARVQGGKLDDLLGEAIAMFAAGEPLPPRFHEHALAGRWKDFRDCHVRPDLVLIYRKNDSRTLELVRLGSHSEFGFSSEAIKRRHEGSAHDRARRAEKRVC